MVALLSLTLLCGCDGVLYFIFMPEKDDDKPPASVLPGQVSNPSPSSGATDVPITSNLMWSAAANATSYDVYFGTVESAVTDATAGSPELQA